MFRNETLSEVSNDLEHITMLYLHHRLCSSQGSYQLSEITLHKGTTKHTENANVWKAIAMH